jgi:hypothetical protein
VGYVAARGNCYAEILYSWFLNLTDNGFVVLTLSSHIWDRIVDAEMNDELKIVKVG